MKSLSNGLNAFVIAATLAAGTSACDREIGVPTVAADTLSDELPVNMTLGVPSDADSVVGLNTNQTSAFVSVVIDNTYENGLPQDFDSGLIAERLSERLLAECGEVSDQMLTISDTTALVEVCIEAGNFTTARQLIQEFSSQNGESHQREVQELLEMVNIAENNLDTASAE